MSQIDSKVNFFFKCDKQLHHVAEKLVTLYREEELYDTTLIAGADNMEVKTHRAVLYLSSEYFQAMFHTGSKESKGEAIHLNTIDGDTLQKVIGFMYTFEIEITKESIEKVLSAANLFQMKSLKEWCCNLLADQLNASNCLKFVHLAEQHNYATLYERSLDYSYKNLEQVADEEEFLKLTEPQLSKFLSQDGVNAVSQEILFLSLIKWLKQDLQTRNESMYILLNDFVRFSQLDPEFILENAESLAHIVKCSKLIFSWLKWHSSEEKRKKRQKKLKILLAYNNGGVFKVNYYDPDLNKWSVEDWPQPSKMRAGYGIVITQNKCIIAGGIIYGGYTNSVECLDLETMKWRCLPPMITERLDFGMAVLNGIIYAVGGENYCGRSIRLVEKYDFTDDKWTSLAELPVALSWVRAVPLGGKLYVSGKNISHLMCYDPATNKWSETPDKNEKSVDFGLTASKEYVYAVRGCFTTGQEVNTVERYNPANNTWTIIESMTTKYRTPTCWTVGDKLLVCGGIYPTSRRVFKEYNEKTKKWKDLTQCLETFENTWELSDYLSTLSIIE